MAEEKQIMLSIKWAGTEYNITMPFENTVQQLKLNIEEKTGVKINRQKLLGLKYKGKVPGENIKLRDLGLKQGQRVMMMGTREELIVEDVPEGFDDNDVLNDLDWCEEQIAVKDRDINLAKIRKRVETYKFKVVNQPRSGKKLLVLDVDYTLFDHRSIAESPLDLMRPFLHDFLTAAYQYYDIAIWSATGMKWVEVKMAELGVLNNPNYKVTLLIDHLAMISVESPKYGLIHTKPLAVIWNCFPDYYNTDNTIMFDDLRRNFIMNPQNGLHISAYRNSAISRHTDTTLKKLTRYLLYIAPFQSLANFNHDDWKKIMKERKDRKE